RMPPLAKSSGRNGYTFAASFTSKVTVVTVSARTRGVYVARTRDVGCSHARLAPNTRASRLNDRCIRPRALPSWEQPKSFRREVGVETQDVGNSLCLHGLEAYGVDQAHAAAVDLEETREPAAV